MKDSKARRFWRSFFKVPEVVVPFFAAAFIVVGLAEYEDGGKWIALSALAVLGVYSVMTYLEGK